MDVADYLSVLRRRWLAIVVCLVAGVVCALSITRSTPETYRASARLFVNIPEARGVQESLQGVQLTSGLLRSYAEVASSRSAAQRVIDELELDMSAGQLRSQLSADPTPDTLLITISATDESPALAAELANGASQVFIEIVDELESEREEKIEARVIDGATEPVHPTSPKPRRNLMAGIGLGLGLGLAAAFLLEALDRTIKTPDQASVAAGRPLLAVVPRRRDKTELVTVGEGSDVAGEAYRALRTSLRFLALDTPVRSIMVTSPSAGEGKTTTAANLAVVFAQSGARVVIVDADLRRARVGDIFGVEGPGLTGVLTGQLAVGDALVPWGPNLLVLPAGVLPPNPAELVGSQAMARALTDLDESGLADVVIVDAPPIVPVTDAVALSTQVQAVVLVVRAGRTRRDMAEEAIRRLDVVSAEVVGCVLNAVPRSGQLRYQQDYRYTRAPR